MALCCTLAAEAKPRTQTQIMRLAGETLTAKMGNARYAPGKPMLSVAYSTKALTVVQRSGCGYAIIANDDLLPAVLAYSSTDFANDTDNPGLKWWLGAVEKVCRRHRGRGAPLPQGEARR